MTAGFILREIAAFHHNGEDIASAVQGLFYTATFVFTLPIYVALFHLVSGALKFRLHYFFWAITCFTSAIITCTAQGCATYFSAHQSQSAMRSGLALIKASLTLQLFLNAVFVCLLAVYQYRPNLRLGPQHQAEHQAEHSQSRTVTIILTLYVLIGLILIRNIFRTVQIFTSPRSGLWTDEAYFWVFEPTVILTYSVIWHLICPAEDLCLRARACCNGSQGE
ncbi:hypothetical protein LTS15_010063 [Exophiala xenobiotica]|nr:hypothetical protein LTS15_010063 [Exophiala xenobiotica]